MTQQPENEPQESGQTPDFVPQPPPPAAKKQQSINNLFRKITTTILDPEACRRLVSQLINEKKDQQQGVKSAPDPFELPKEPVPPDQCKMASACSVSWDKMLGTNQLRFCSECQSFVYDFAGLELPEVKNLVFQRENKECSIFFKRRDGKYLTRDCPVGLAQRKKKIVYTVAAGLLPIAMVVAFLMLAPLLASAPESKSVQGEGGKTEATSAKPDTTRKMTSEAPYNFGQAQASTVLTDQAWDMNCSELPPEDVPSAAGSVQY